MIAPADEGERCGPGELFDLLGISHQRGNGVSGSSDSNHVVDVAESIFGHDDQQVGIAEPVAGGGERLSLPSPTVVGSMTPEEREAAADGFIKHIRRYFGLNAGA